MSAINTYDGYDCCQLLLQNLQIPETIQALKFLHGNFSILADAFEISVLGLVLAAEEQFVLLICGSPLLHHSSNACFQVALWPALVSPTLLAAGSVLLSSGLQHRVS